MSAPLLQYLPLLLVCLILLRRTQRPRVLRPARLWLQPAILLIVAAFYTYAAVHSGPPMHAPDFAIIAATALAGIGLGALRAHSVKLTRHPDTGVIEATLTMWGLAVIVVWIAGKMLLRQTQFAGATVPFGIFTDAAIALACAMVLAQSIVLTQRCRALEDGKLPS